MLIHLKLGALAAFAGLLSLVLLGGYGDVRAQANLRQAEPDVLVQSDPAQAENCVYNNDVQGRYTVNPNYQRVLIHHGTGYHSEGGGHIIRTCVKKGLPYRVETIVVGEPDRVTGLNRGRSCPTGWLRTFTTEAGGGFFDTCMGPSSDIFVQYVGEYDPRRGPSRACPSDTTLVYLSQYRSGINGTCTSTPVAADLKVNHTDGPLSLAGGSSFTLNWVATGSSSFIFDSPPPGCPGVGRLGKPAQGSQTLVAPSVTKVTECRYAGRAQVGSVTRRDAVVVTIEPTAPAPTIELTINGLRGDGSAGAGQPFSLGWTTTNTRSVGVSTQGSGCPRAGQRVFFRWFLLPPTGGSQTLTAPLRATTCSYTATAIGPGGETAATARVTVTLVPVGSSFSCRPTTVLIGSPSTSCSFSITNLKAGDQVEIRQVCRGSGLASTVHPVAPVSIPNHNGTQTVTFPAGATGSCELTLVVIRQGAVVSSSGPVTITVDTRAEVVAPAPTISNFSCSPTTVTNASPRTVCSFAASNILSGDTPVVRESCSFGSSRVASVSVSSSLNGSTPFEFETSAPLSGTCTYAFEIARGVTVAARRVAAPVTVNITGGPDTSCRLLVCINYDPRVITLPPPGFTRIMQPLISEVAP